MSYDNNDKPKVNWIQFKTVNGINLVQSDGSGLIKFIGTDLNGRTDNMQYGLRPEFLLSFLEGFGTLDEVRDSLRELVIGREHIQTNKKASKVSSQLMQKLEEDKRKIREKAAKTLREAGVPEQVIIETLAKMA